MTKIEENLTIGEIRNRMHIPLFYDRDGNAVSCCGEDATSLWVRGKQQVAVQIGKRTKLKNCAKVYAQKMGGR